MTTRAAFVLGFFILCAAGAVALGLVYHNYGTQERFIEHVESQVRQPLIPRSL
jgi:hypothetical protein